MHALSDIFYMLSFYLSWKEKKCCRRRKTGDQIKHINPEKKQMLGMVREKIVMIWWIPLVNNENIV